MSITLEKIDLIRSRAHVTYEEAKIALEQCNYDEIEALIYLEKNKKTVQQPQVDKSVPEQGGPSVWEQIKSFIAKVHAVRFVVEKESIVIINVPLTVLILSLMILFPFIVTLGVLGLIFGYKMTFVKSKTETYEVNSIFNETFEKVKASQTAAPAKDHSDESTEPKV